MRKIIVCIAVSADGFIARPDGDVAWLERPEAAGDYGMARFYKTIDTIIWGRKTYDFGVRVGAEFDTSVKNYVFSRRPPESPAAGVEFVAGSVRDFAGRIRGESGKDIWMMGGGEIIASFLDEGLIDEFKMHVMPVFIGEGIPLVAPRRRDVALQLLNFHRYPDGVVELHYAVRSAA